jgi:hypothetical protein
MWREQSWGLEVAPRVFLFADSSQTLKFVNTLTTRLPCRPRLSPSDPLYPDAWVSDSCTRQRPHNRGNTGLSISLPPSHSSSHSVSVHTESGTSHHRWAKTFRKRRETLCWKVSPFNPLLLRHPLSLTDWHPYDKNTWEMMSPRCLSLPNQIKPNFICHIHMVSRC